MKGFTLCGPLSKRYKLYEKYEIVKAVKKEHVRLLLLGEVFQMPHYQLTLLISGINTLLMSSINFYPTILQT